MYQTQTKNRIPYLLVKFDADLHQESEIPISQLQARPMVEFRLPALMNRQFVALAANQLEYEGLKLAF